MSPRIFLVHQFDQQQAETEDVRFSFDGKRLVSTDGSALYLWRLNQSGDWDYERSLPHSALKPSFTFDGRGLAFGDRQGSLRLISLEDEKEERILPCSARTNCAFSPDRHWLVVGDTNRALLLWDLLTFQSFAIASPLPGFQGNLEESKMDWSDEIIEHIRFTPDGQRLALAVANGQGYGRVHICHFDPINKQLPRQTTLRYGCIDLALSPNGKMLATIDAQPARGPIQDIYIYDLDSFQLLHCFPQRDRGCYCLLAFSPDSHSLMSCKDNGMVDLFSLNPFEQIASFAAHPGLFLRAMDPIGGFDWSRTGSIATGGASVFESNMQKKDYTIKIWRVED